MKKLLCAMVLIFSAAPTMAAEANGKTIAATGQVVEVVDSDTIKIKHDPIPALKWPVMTMFFDVAAGVDLTAYHEGDAVSFTLQAEGKNNYIIATMKKD